MLFGGRSRVLVGVIWGETFWNILEKNYWDSLCESFFVCSENKFKTCINLWDPCLHSENYLQTTTKMFSPKKFLCNFFSPTFFNFFWLLALFLLEFSPFLLPHSILIVQNFLFLFFCYLRPCPPCNP